MVRKRLSQEPVAVRIIPSLLQVTKQDQQLHVTWPQSAHLWVSRLNPSPLWASGFQSLDEDPQEDKLDFANSGHVCIHKVIPENRDSPK